MEEQLVLEEHQNHLLIVQVKLEVLEEEQLITNHLQVEQEILQQLLYLKEIQVEVLHQVLVLTRVEVEVEQVLQDQMELDHNLDQVE